MRESELLDVTSHCEGLQGYPDTHQFAVALSEHIKTVQEAVRETAKDLKFRHDMLQVLENLYQALAKQLTVFFEFLSQVLDFFLVIVSASFLQAVYTIVLQFVSSQTAM